MLEFGYVFPYKILSEVVDSDVCLLCAARKKFQLLYQVLGIASVVKPIIKALNNALENSRTMLRVIFLVQRINKLKPSNHLHNVLKKRAYPTWPGTTTGFSFASGGSL